MNENMTKYRRIISALSVAIVILLLSNYSALRKLDIATRGNFDEPEYVEEPEFETVCRASPEEIPNLRYEKVRIM